jgi:site-specific DNA recombinase
MEKKMKSAVGYIRVSTQEQASEGISLANQRVKIETYCQLNDLELGEIIEDAGKSGKNLNRDGIQQLVSHIKGHKVDAVIVYKLDRLSRSVLDTLTLIETIEKHHMTFHSLNEKIDTGTAMGRFFLNITASLAQMERDLISERTKDALQMKIHNCERAGQVPYGWQLAEDKKTLLPIEKEQAAIVRARRLKDGGNSYRIICQTLNTEGFKPQSGAWHPQKVANMLNRAA